MFNNSFSPNSDLSLTVNSVQSAQLDPVSVSISGSIDHTTHQRGQSGTVTFNRFPATVDEWKQVREQIGSEPHGAIALQVMASEMYRRDPKIGKECIELNNVVSNIPSCIRRLQDLFVYEKNPYQMAYYLKGATQQNGFNPPKPYTIEVKVSNNAYAKSTDYQTVVLNLSVNSSGHDSSPLPCSVLKTKRPGESGENGKFFLVFGCSSLYLKGKQASFESTFRGLD